MKSLIFAAAALLVAGPAFAQGGASVRSSSEGPQGTSEAGANANGERRMCRRIESSANRTGARRVCLTAAEWRSYNRSVDDSR